MNVYIALLRGINVGGHKKIPMAELRKLLTKIGFSKVKTYIQSGNVVFRSSIENTKTLETKIKTSILNHFGFEVSIMVRTRNQLNTIFENCPFLEAIRVNSYFTILSSIANEVLVKEASKKTYKNEEYYIINDAIYFYCANGYGNAKFNLNYFEKKLNVSATSKNYKTMLKLLAMSLER